MDKKIKCIYNMRLAGYLMMNGIRIIRMEKNLGRPWRNVFIFEDTDEVIKLIEKYKNEKSKENNYGANNRKSENKT